MKTAIGHRLDVGSDPGNGDAPGNVPLVAIVDVTAGSENGIIVIDEMTHVSATVGATMVLLMTGASVKTAETDERKVLRQK